jgi:hypothetical protein
MRVRVAGVTFEGRQEIIKACMVGDMIMLMPEPTNEHDPNAVQVVARVSSQDYNWLTIGYIPKKISEHVARYVAKGYKETGSYTTGEIVEIHGGEDGLSLGVTIEFDIPEGD